MQYIHVRTVHVHVCVFNEHVHVYIQWSPSIMDTIGTSKLVLLMEASEGSIKNQNGTRKVSLVVRCPLFRGVLYNGSTLVMYMYSYP